MAKKKSKKTYYICSACGEIEANDKNKFECKGCKQVTYHSLIEHMPEKIRRELEEDV